MPYLLAIPHYSWLFSHASYSSRASSRSRSSSYSRVQFSLSNVTPPILKTRKGKLSRGQILLSQLFTVLEDIKHSFVCRCDWTFVAIEWKVFFTTNIAGSIEAFNRFNTTSTLLLELHSNFKKHISFLLLSKEAAHAAILFSGMGK